MLNDSPSAAISKAAPHYGYLDGMRGVASLFVVLHHLWLAANGIKALDGVPGLAVNWLLYGHLAVDVFIVLSGFCLTMPLTRPDSPMRIDVWDFYRRRARRILPPYFAMLVFSILLVVMARLLFGKRSGMPFDAWGVLANVFLLQDVFPSINYFNGPFWSVAVETKIYFLFPLLVWVAGRFGAGVSLLLACVIGYGATALVMGLAPGVGLGHSCIWYVALFGMGMSAALCLKLRQLDGAGRVASIAMPVFAAASAALLYAYPVTASGEEERFVPHLVYIDSAVGALAATFLFWVTMRVRAGRSNAAIALLSWRPLVFVGSFAYSLYLVHYPLIGYSSVFVTRILHVQSAWSIAAALLVVALPLILIAAYLFFLAFERPFLTRLPKAAPRERTLARSAP